MNTTYPQCVGCGYCCLSGMCTLGMRHTEERSRCPFLIWSESKSRYLCTLILTKVPGYEDLYHNIGCASNLNTWRKEVKYRG